MNHQPRYLIIWKERVLYDEVLRVFKVPKLNVFKMSNHPRN